MRHGDDGKPAPPEQLQADEDAETSRRAQSECLAMISHEVRTPMSAILGMVDLLQMTSMTRRQQAYVRTIHSSGTALLSLVDNVIDFAEMQSGRPILREQAFDIRQFIENVIDMMGFQAYSKGLELGCRISPDIPAIILGDEIRLQQVLVNLVNNAVRFTARGHVIIDVSTAVGADGRAAWVFSVTDTGVGIAAADKARLFAPLVVDQQQDNRRKKGTGLGLIISRWLLEGMGGSIHVASDPEHGTRVACELPLVVPADATPDAPAHEELCGKSALIIHDNAAMAAILGSSLEDWGMHFDAIYDVEFGIARLRSLALQGKHYDVVILDTKPGGTDGLSLARNIRAESVIADLPIIMLTPMTYPLEVGQISRIGGIRCVNKPVAPTQLGHQLQRLIGVDQARRFAASGDDASAKAMPGDIRILVAEDNVLSRQILQNMLVTQNYLVDAVADGPAVLAALAAKPYDLVLMDCQMPGIDGDIVTQRIRAHPEKFKSQPLIVAVTANVSERQRSKCLAAGMDDFIPKPVRRKGLLEGLQRWGAIIDAKRQQATTSPESATPEQQLRQHLQERAGNNSDFLRGYIDLFLADTDSRLHLLDDALRRNDMVVIRRQSHALKGACLEMGAFAMARQCVRVQTATEGDVTLSVPDAVTALKQALAEIRPVLRELKQAAV